MSYSTMGSGTETAQISFLRNIAILMELRLGQEIWIIWLIGLVCGCAD